MTYKIVIDKRAIIDIQDAINYYDLMGENLAYVFYETLESHIKIISRNPYYQKKYKDYHALPMKRFPFILIYYIQEETKTVYLMSVFNTFLNPKKYPK